MGYISKGCWIVYLSPYLSFFATLLVIVGIDRFIDDWFLQTVLFALVQLFLVCIQFLGLAFCFAGFRRNELMPFRLVTTVSLSVLLALWGVFTFVLAWGSYNDLLWWSHMPEVRSLTIWDHLEFLIWAFKGSLWILAAITVLIMAFIRKRLVPRAHLE